MSQMKLNHGAMVNGEPLTTSTTGKLAPGLLLNEIDRRVTMIRPTATPVDQISRCGGCRQSGSMIVEYYSVSAKPDTANVTLFRAASKLGDVQTYTLSVDSDIFQESETILCIGAQVPGDETTVALYVMSRDEATGNLTVIPLVSDNVDMSDVTIDSTVTLVRMGRAATELDVQTPQFEALPTKDDNYCQIFKMQIEESTYQKIANKEVGWTFSDQEEIAIMDMRLGMEKNFLFGMKKRFTNPRKHEEVLTTGGIYMQAGKDFSLSKAALGEAQLIDMLRDAFTGTGGGSTRKILVGGSELISSLSKIATTHVVMGAQTFTRWGIDFNEITSKFGTLLVKYNEVFDICGHSADGLVFDPQYLTKYAHVPFKAEKLDLRTSGQRNTNAVVATEASCLVLRCPDAHMRVHLTD